MKRASPAAAGLLLGALILPGPIWASSFDVTSDKIEGIPKGGNARITATVGGTAVASARVYFRAEQEKHDYYLEMRRASDGQYWAVTPVPKSETKTALYRVVFKNPDGVESSTPLYSVPVSDKVSVKLNDDETRYAKNLVIGQTEQDVPFLPPGWECTGVISGITVQGELKPNELCRGTPWLVWAAVPVLLGSGAVIVNPVPNEPVSPSRPPAATPR